MKVTLEIPKEFESDFNKDRFKDFFMRVRTDIEYSLDNKEIRLAGNYEKETADMFIEAFKNAQIS